MASVMSQPALHYQGQGSLPAHECVHDGQFRTNCATCKAYSPGVVRSVEEQLKEQQRRLHEREEALRVREQELEKRIAAFNSLQEDAAEAAAGSKDDDEKFRCYWRAGMWIKSLVFGGLDGLTTTIALICSAAAGGEAMVSVRATLVMGCATLLADGFSMGIGDYLSSLAEGDVLQTGTSHDWALKNGVVMFGSFVLFGGIPLLSFAPFLKMTLESRFHLSCFFCAICLFILGSVKGRLEGSKVARAGIVMVMMGSIASILSWIVSEVMHKLVV